MFSDLLNSKFYAVCLAFTKWIYLTLLFLVFSLPIITAGTSLTALIATIRQPEYEVWKIFWKTYKENFIRGTVVFIFTGFTLMFLFQAWNILGAIPGGNIIYLFLLIFLIVYNLNAYLFVSILNKCGITFFRQVFFFTIGTLYKTFFVPILGAGIFIVAPIIGGNIMFLLSISIILTIYVAMVKKDIQVVEELI